MPAQRVIDLGQSRQAVLWALRAVVALMVAAALTLLLRRLDGACSVAPTALVLLLAGMGTVGVSVAVRLTARSLAHAKRDQLALEIAASSVVWPLAVAVSVPGAPAWALAALWLMVCAEEGWAWFAKRPAWPVVSRVSFGEMAEVDESAGDLDEAVLPEGVCQHLTRTVVDGVDQLSALVRVGFAQGARTANAHVAFCPPFVAVPGCEAEVVEGPECRMKVAQILPYGVRLEFKLSEPAEESCEAIVRIGVGS